MSVKPVIGLTGGIASGKSVVAAILRDEQIEVVDADRLAREVVAPGSEGLQEVVTAFGAGILNADGGLDREALGRVVFADAHARQRLEAITHPRIGRLSAERLTAAQRGSGAYVVYEAPLLVETGAHRRFAALVVVSATSATQIARAASRDGLDHVDAQARIAAQLPLLTKTEVADWVIENDGSLEDLRTRTLEVHRAILTRFTHA